MSSTIRVILTKHTFTNRNISKLKPLGGEPLFSSLISVAMREVSTVMGVNWEGLKALVHQ